MALSDSHRAIGAVTRLLSDHLVRRGFGVTVGKPEEAAASDSDAKLNLFLYETQFDASLRNLRLDPDGPDPLWLTLKFLLTAFDEGEKSDTADAHELLGRGMVALHELNFLRLDSSVPGNVRLALENNPEPLKITFDESPPDLLSKLIQNTDEKYRLSVALQVRPVMLIPSEPPDSALLVGMDYTETPPEVIGGDGVRIEALAGLGPRLDRVEPEAFEPGQVISVHGSDLHFSGLECLLSDQVLRITGQLPDRLTVEVEGTRPAGAAAGPIASGGSLAPGEHPLRVRQPRDGGRYRGSNLLVGRLRPVVADAVIAAGDLVITGTVLGREEDDVFVALYADGRVVRSFDAVTTAADQSSVTVTGLAAAAPAGTYRVILRVNGQQARRSPSITVS